MCLRHPTLMAGYRGAPDATAEAFTPDGYLRMGDIGVLREDGNLRLIARTKQVFRSGGYNIYPREIELALEGHPSVKLAAVVPAPILATRRSASPTSSCSRTPRRRPRNCSGGYAGGLPTTRSPRPSCCSPSCRHCRTRRSTSAACSAWPPAPPTRTCISYPRLAILPCATGAAMAGSGLYGGHDCAVRPVRGDLRLREPEASLVSGPWVRRTAATGGVCYLERFRTHRCRLRIKVHGSHAD